MSGIEDAHEGLNQLSEQVDRYQETVDEISNEPRYSSFSERALHAGQLATELAGLVQGLADDVNEYTQMLSPLRKEGAVHGFELQGLVDFAQEVTAGTQGILSEVPAAIGYMGGAVGGIIHLVSKETKYVDGYASKITVIANGLNKLGETLPGRKEASEERVRELNAGVKDMIERGKSTI